MNNVFLVGRLTKDAEMRQTNSGKSVCSFGLAVDRKYKDQDGNKVTDFFKCTAWNGLAENIVKYTSKGSQVAVIGEMQAESWEKDGVTHYGVNILVEQCKFLNSKEENTEPEKQQDAFEGIKPVKNEELPF